MRTRLLLAPALVSLLCACGTSKDVTQAMIAAHSAAQAQPTLTLDCPAGGCRLSYTDPRDRQQFKAPTNGWDAMLGIGHTAVGLVQSSVVPLALGAVAIKGMQEVAGAKGSSITNTTGPVTTTTTNTGPVSTTTRGDVQANRTNSTVLQTESTTTGATTTIGPNSGANSGNSGRLAGTSMTDNTSTPTVVNQPAPVVVTQPAPVVVTQPAPVVVVPPSPAASGAGG